MGYRKTRKDVVVPIGRFYLFYSKKLKRRYGLAFEKFCDIRDIHRAPNRMSGVYTIYYKTMNYLFKFRLKNVDAALQFGFREILRYSRHLSSAEPDVWLYTIILYNDEPSI